MTLLSKTIVGVLELTEEGDVIQLIDEASLSEVSSSWDKVITDNRWVYETLSDHINKKLDLSNIVLKKIRNNRFEFLLNNSMFIGELADYYDLVREKAIELSRDSVRQFSQGRDTLIAQAVLTVDELQRSYIQLGIRLQEIYSLHFPEILVFIRTSHTLARVISACPDKSELSLNVLNDQGLDSEISKLILNSRETSLGADFDSIDYAMLKSLANEVVGVYQQKTELENWISETMVDIAPNLSAVAGTNVGARLISQAGSLKELAFSPAGKIQTLGAEKALYKAIKSRGKTPKHGIIFQIPEVGTMPFWLRGKMARAFSAKIAIATKLDFFKGENRGTEIRKGLIDYSKTLRERFPKAPERFLRQSKQSYKRNKSNQGKKRRRQRR